MNTLISELQTLCSAGACGGEQAAIAKPAMEMLRPYVDELSQDAMGNILAIRHCDNPQAKTVLLEAHMDEIGFIVTHIDNDGFIHVAPVGGVDARTITAQSVIVHGNRPYEGVFCSVPPHLAGDNKTPLSVEKTGIDIGLPPDAVRAGVPQGSRVTLAPNFAIMHDTLIVSKSLDNRSGMAAIIHCLRQLKNANMHVAVAFCVQEELGCRGAAVAARQLKPDIAIVTDVSFADAHGENAAQCGKIGNGVMIGVSPVLDHTLTQHLFNIARKADISCQTEVMAGITGTDADQISLTDYGIPCGLLSIPLRYMHTANEIVNVHDIEAVATVMARFIEEGLA